MEHIYIRKKIEKMLPYPKKKINIEWLPTSLFLVIIFRIFVVITNHCYKNKLAIATTKALVKVIFFCSIISLYYFKKKKYNHNFSY